MKTIKILTMAALALMTAACSNDDNELTTPQPAEAEGIPFTATITVDKGATTRALAETGDHDVIATWAAGEKVALIYTVGTTTYVKEAEVTPQAGGNATISTTLDGSPADDTDVTIVYPASAVDATTKDVKAGLLATQNGLLTGDGSISKLYDLRKTTTPAKLKIDGTTASLKGNVSLTNQNSIFKFTLKDIAGTADKTATQFIVSNASGDVLTTVTPGSATNVLYVALPALATGTYWFNATVGGKPYIAKATVGTATTAGNYYQSTVKMATIGDYLNKDGSFTATKQASGDNESQAVIAYVGSVDKYFSRFLALALTDVDNDYHYWAEAALTAVGTYAAAHPITIGSTTYKTSTTGATYYDQVADNQTFTSATRTGAAQTGWRLPSVTDWRYVFDGLGRIKGGLALSDGTNALTPTSPLGVSDGMVYRNGDDGSSLCAAINTACGNNALQQSKYYWSSSDYTVDSDRAWRYGFGYGNFWYYNKTPPNSYVRAVFAY